jgi:hypothetical protein
MADRQLVMGDENALVTRLAALKGLIKIRKLRVRQASRRAGSRKGGKVGPMLWRDIQSEMVWCREQLRVLRVANRRRANQKRR